MLNLTKAEAILIVNALCLMSNEGAHELAKRLDAYVQGQGKLHFHSSDPRFCGTPEMGREWSPDEAAVTCPCCKEKAGRA